MIHDLTPARAIDWESPGARLHHIPFTLDGTWGRVRMPLYVACAARPGKTIAAIGGTHGDEYEGPVGLKNLIRELDPASLVGGRLIVIPVLNVPAFRADQRHSPLDGKNMNRAFPGDAGGTITDRIARFVYDEVIARADIVIDIRAAGPDFEIARCASFHHLPDPAHFGETARVAMLFGMPFAWVYTSDMGTGLLTEAAEALGKVTIGGEFGYGASADLQGVRWAHHGVLNVMRDAGLLPGPIENLVPPSVDRQRLVWATDVDRWLTAPADGVGEPLVALGGYVRAGQPVVRLHDFDRIDEPGLIIPADQDGYVLVRRFRAVTRQGDVVMVIAQEREA
jgi:predicted deacylase